MKKYIRIREDNNGRTVEMWAVVPEERPLLTGGEEVRPKDKEFPMHLMVTSLMFWGILGIIIGDFIFN